MQAKQLHIPEYPRWHHTSLRIPLFEVDLGQGVYHGNYFHLFELAREAFLRDCGYPYRRFMEARLHLTVAKIECTYQASLHYDEVVAIHTAIAWWRERSLGITQKIFREEGGATATRCTEATFNMVCVHFSGKATGLPPDFVKCLQRWTSDGENIGAQTEERGEK